METGNPSASKEVRVGFDASYIFNLGAILKCLQILLNLIGLIVIQMSRDNELSRAVYFSFVTGTGFCLSIVLLLLHFFRITEATSMIPWLKVELIYCLTWVFFHVIAGSLTIGLINEYFNTAGYFAFSAMVAYALEAIYHIIKMQLKK